MADVDGETLSNLQASDAFPPGEYRLHVIVTSEPKGSNISEPNGTYGHVGIGGRSI